MSIEARHQGLLYLELWHLVGSGGHNEAAAAAAAAFNQSPNYAL